jgi:hypothetical protein
MCWATACRCDGRARKAGRSAEKGGCIRRCEGAKAPRLGFQHNKQRVIPKQVRSLGSHANCPVTRRRDWSRSHCSKRAACWRRWTLPGLRLKKRRLAARPTRPSGHPLAAGNARSGKARRCDFVRRGGRSRLRCAGTPFAARAGHPRAAQGTGTVRQPAPGETVSRTRRCFGAAPRSRQPDRHGDRARTQRRRLFRRKGHAHHRRWRREGYDIMSYAEDEVRRIARVGFETAMARGKKLCSVDKANVLETSQLWRDVVIETAKEFPEGRIQPHVCR